MKRILVFVVIICFALLLCVNAQDKSGTKVEINNEGNPEIVEPKPAPKPVTRLDVKIIDDMNDKVVELNNCIVQVIGELHICEDSFNYSNAFTEGDKYEMIIWVKLKK
jgi:hypothetical protein